MNLCTAAIKSPPWMIWFDTLFKMSRNQCEQRLNLNCINMNLSSLHWVTEFEFHEYSNFKWKGNTWISMRQSLKLTNNYSIIHIQISFIQTEPWAPEHLEGTCVPWVTGRQLPPPRLQWSDTLHLANWKPCGTVPFSSSQPVNKSPLHLVKGMQIVSYSYNYYGEKKALMGLAPFI